MHATKRFACLAVLLTSASLEAGGLRITYVRSFGHPPRDGTIRCFAEHMPACYDAKGHLYVAGGGNLQKFDKDLSILWTTHGFFSVNSLMSDGEHIFYTTGGDWAKEPPVGACRISDGKKVGISLSLPKWTRFRQPYDTKASDAPRLISVRRGALFILFARGKDGRDSQLMIFDKKTGKRAKCLAFKGQVGAAYVEPTSGDLYVTTGGDYYQFSAETNYDPPDDVTSVYVMKDADGIPKEAPAGARIGADTGDAEEGEISLSQEITRTTWEEVVPQPMELDFEGAIPGRGEQQVLPATSPVNGDIAYAGQNCLIVFDKRGKLKHLVEYVREAQTADMDEHGNVYLAGRVQSKRYNPEGYWIGGFANADILHYDGLSQTFYLAYKTGIARCDKNGKILSRLGLDHHTHCKGLAVHDKWLYFSSRYEGEIKRVKRDLTGPPEVAISNLYRPTRIAFDRHGNLYVASANGQIEKYVPNAKKWQLEWKIGPVPSPAADHPGHHPILSVDGELLYVADLTRIGVYTLQGNPVRTLEKRGGENESRFSCIYDLKVRRMGERACLMLIDGNDCREYEIVW